ncbi:rubrerythrin [Clostridium carboxidivorans P7]|uniref:Rubrerythrin n=1 Tax=Clostridium carboxidivorans P7 TaxID=536227 RepID=C6PYZ1_9CLOT|nr:ferritin family protein [Clostridium carboxidivorans]AKN31338.1 rubrerythrin [Clostridium carboxidivorans P7]EET85525.1 Rubrerythrin [Clostridium carboxidivorans P7]
MNSFEFAINMELDGEKYYMEQAEINKGNELNAIFIRLAKDEKNHAKIFQNKLNKLSYELKDNNTLSEFKDVFKGIGDFKNEIKKIPNQLDLYRNALEKEKQSIELYKKFLSETTDDKEKKIFEYLIKEEEDHFAILDELVLLINHADEWVESAEFGIREEF